MMRPVAGLAGLAALVLAGASDPATAREDCALPFSEVFAKVSPAVVSVLSVSVDPFSLTQRVVSGLGSGVAIDADGHVLTNAHVVFGSTKLMVTTPDDQRFSAALLGADPILDLAVLKVDAPAGALPAATLGSSESLRVGEAVLAIGNPFALGATATSGIVSAIGRVVRRTTMSWLAPLIQTDAAINPGNSGGPLVDSCAEVVAINSLRVAKGENISFAVPIDLAREAIPQLIEKGRVIRPWHGIYGKLVDVRLFLLMRVPIVPGFLIETVEPGSPADKIGLRGGSFPVRLGPLEYLLGGDILTRVNGELLSDMATVMRIVRGLKVGDTLKIQYFRDGDFHEAEVTLPERPVLPSDARWMRSPDHQD